MAFYVGPQGTVREDQNQVRSMALAALARARHTLRSFTRGPFNLKDASLTKYFSSGRSAAGVVVNEWTALNYAAFFQGVALISGHMGAFPLFLYKRTKSTTGRAGKERYQESRLFWLLHDEWNPEMTSQAARETMQAWALTWGNGYAEIDRNAITGQVAGLYVITPDRVRPFRDDVRGTDGVVRKGPLQYEVSNFGAKPTILRADQIVHLHGLGFDGTTGYSVIEKARASIGLGLAAERSGEAFFGNGQTFGGILSTEGDMDEEELKLAREAIEAVHQGPDRAHKFLVLKNGLKYTPIGVKPGDAQFLESRKFQIEEIARWLNLPPHKLKDLDRSTNNNIEHQGIEYYTDTLYPWQVRWEQELNRKLIPASERRIQFIEHMVDGVLRGDIGTRYAAYAIGRQWGWLSADDVRGFENLNPLPSGGDTYLSPTNMAPADLLDELTKAQIQKTKRAGTGSTTTPPPGGADPTPDDDDPEDEEKSREDLVSELRRLRAQIRVLGLAAHDAGVVLRSEREALASALHDSEAVESERDAAREAANQAAADLARVTEQLGERTARIAELETAVATADQAARELAAGEIAAVRAELAGVSADLGQAIEHGRELEQQLAAEGTRAIAAEGQVDAIRGELEAQRTEHAAALEQLREQSAAEIATMIENAASLNATIQQRDAQLLEIRGTVAELQDRADQVAGELAAVRLAREEATTAAEAVREDLERQVREASELARTEQAERLARETELAAAQERADASANEAAGIRAQLAEATRAHDAALAAAQLAGEALRDAAWADANERAARARDEHAAELEQLRAELEARAAAAEGQAAQDRASLEQLRAEHDAAALEARQAAERFETEIGATRAELTNARATADALTATIEQLRTEATAAAGELEAARRELHDANNTWAVQLAELEAAGAALEARGEQLSADAAAQTARIAELERTQGEELERRAATEAEHLAELERLRPVPAQLEAQRAEFEARAEQLAADVAARTARIAELEDQHGTELELRAAHIAEQLAELEQLRPLPAQLEAAQHRASELDGLSTVRLEQLNTRDARIAELEAVVAAAPEQSRAAIAAAEAAAAEQVRAVRAAELERLANMIQAHRAIFLDPMARMIHRETERVRSRARTRERLELWIREFYPMHERTMAEALLPVVRVHLVWSGSGEDPAHVTRQAVRRYTEESIRLLRSLSESDEQLPEAIETLVASWETVRAEAFADRLMREEIEYVRSYRV